LRIATKRDAVTEESRRIEGLSTGRRIYFTAFLRSSRCTARISDVFEVSFGSVKG